jgi:hypothetical protein
VSACVLASVRFLSCRRATLQPRFVGSRAAHATTTTATTTICSALHAKRLPVEDVPAIYFIAPTEENVERLCKDLKDALYDQYHVNFAGTTPRALLERLADSALESDRVSLITKVYDQFLGFQALAPSLFTLALPNSYYAFNDPRVSDAQAQANIERCVDGLFAALAVSGVVPIIRCPRNGAAEMVARALSLRLNEHVAARAGSSLASATALSSFRRPLLVVLERGVDLASMMHHPWTYSAMVHDVLGLRLNRVRLPRDDDDAAAAAAAIAANATSTHEPKDGDKVLCSSHFRRLVFAFLPRHRRPRAHAGRRARV